MESADGCICELSTSHWGLAEAASYAMGSQDTTGDGKGLASGNSLLSLSCTSLWSPSWRSCLNPPENDSNICQGKCDRSECCSVWIWLSHAPMWVCALSLSCGMGYVEFLSLSSLLSGFEVLSFISKFSPWMVIDLALWGTRQPLRIEIS